MAPHQDEVATLSKDMNKMTLGQPQLSVQDLETLDITKLILLKRNKQNNNIKKFSGNIYS